jgi:small conductance mechanosensitive channel
VNFSLLDKGKRALDAAGISIPFPQMDVHVKS